MTSTSSITQNIPLLEVTKTASVADINNNAKTDLGDVITYNISIENKGNVILSGLIVSDTLTDGLGNALNLNSALSFINGTAGSNSTTLQVSGTINYRASFNINQQSVDTGSIINTVSVTASSPGNVNDVNDVSDDGIDNDGNTTNDPTIINTVSEPSINITKSATVSDVNGNGINDTNDIIVIFNSNK